MAEPGSTPETQEGNPGTPVAEAYGRIDVTIPPATHEAGKLSIVSIVIRNPFDKPVDILEIEGPRSSYLANLESRVGANQQGEKTPKSWLSSLRDYFARFTVSQVRMVGITAEFPRRVKSFHLNACPQSQVHVNGDLSEYDSVLVNAEDGSTVNFSPHFNRSSAATAATITIQPRCEAIAYFNVQTSGWLFFTPMRQTLSTQLRYRIDGRERTQIISTDFEMKPPLRAIVIGAVLGAILGALAKFLTTQRTLEWSQFVIAAAGSTVMSLIAGIALSRKTSAQAFITVEDFFGGFVVGALIGYGGSQYFEKSLLPQSGPARS